MLVETCLDLLYWLDNWESSG